VNLGLGVSKLKGRAIKKRKKETSKEEEEEEEECKVERET